MVGEGDDGELICSHVDETGRVRMVDVGGKDVTRRAGRRAREPPHGADDRAPPA